MSEEQKKSERTLEQIQNEFGQLCARAGHVQYQISVLEKDLGILNSSIRDLNLEAAAVKGKEEPAKEGA